MRLGLQQLVRRLHVLLGQMVARCGSRIVQTLFHQRLLLLLNLVRYILLHTLALRLLGEQLPGDDAVQHLLLHRVGPEGIQVLGKQRRDVGGGNRLAVHDRHHPPARATGARHQRQHCKNGYEKMSHGESDYSQPLTKVNVTGQRPPVAATRLPLNGHRHSPPDSGADCGKRPAVSGVSRYLCFLSRGLSASLTFNAS